MPIIMLTLMDAPQIGPQRMGAAGGLYFTAGEVGGVLGPLLLGIMRDLTGGFRVGLFTLAGLSVVLIFLAVRLGFALRRQT
jgi:MFS-type transporter involved in bile tolerance (Atg22 family)